ncbi:MAG: site-specific integrase [Alphaproteobacteria bacterium]|nr:site-specific integrase [Alphaproteobacteria bacterium]
MRALPSGSSGPSTSPSSRRKSAPRPSSGGTPRTTRPPAWTPWPSPPKRTTWYDREQTQRFLKHCQRVRPQWHAFFATALRTGLRQGELAALEWHDLDLGDHPRVHVRRAITEGHVGSPKSGLARIVPLPSDLVAILKAHPRRLGTELVFPARDGGYLTNSCCWKRLQFVQRSAGMPFTSVHDLRHSYASQLAMAGVPLSVIQSYLGHADIETTMRYAHLCPRERDRYVERLVVESLPETRTIS